MKLIKKLPQILGKSVPLWAGILFCLGAASAVLYVSFIYSPDFADFFNENISQFMRFIFAKLTYVFPFSIAEAFVFTSPVIVYLAIRGIFRYMDTHEYGFARALVSLVSVFSLLFSLFTLNFAAGYRGASLDEKMGIETPKISVEELETTAKYVVKKLNSLADGVTFTENGSSVRGYSHNDTVSLAYKSYEKLSGEYYFIGNFKAPVKRLAVSGIMTYTHISGIYTFMTGESNLNTNYPEFVNVYTIAHEMAHQRGIARENEANFVAYLVCINSDDVYMQYSGYLNMFEYLVSALSGVSKESAKELYRSLDRRIYDELVSYSKFFEKYQDSTASDVVGTVNDSYLQSQGTPGTKSYGMVVDLAVAYHKSVTGIK